MKVTVAQLTAGTNKAKNLAAIEQAAEKAAEDGARLMLCPELIMYDVSAPDASFAPIAEPVDGPFVTELRRVARRCGLAIVAGIYEPCSEDERVYNTEVAVGPAGETLAIYRKLHLYDALGWQESARIAPAGIEGNTGVVFDLDGWRFGVVNCFDLRFPELLRTLADAGADVILHPTAWIAHAAKEGHYELFRRARAIENTCYLMSANQTPPTYTGRSAIIDPMGVAIAGLSEDEGIATATLSRERLISVREQLPLLRLRRLGCAN